jgi:hypothetical protein
MAGSVTVDASQLEKLLPAYLKLSQAAAADALNKKALYIASGALDRTRRADRNAIEQLGLVTKSLRQRVTSSGRVRQVRKFDFKAEIAVANYGGALKRHGRNLRQLPDRATVEKAARRWIARKLTSIGVLASGWIAPVRKLAARVGGGQFTPFKDARQYGSPKGYAVPAQSDTLKPFVIIANTANRDRYGKELPAHVQQMKIDALNAAIADETFKTDEYIRRKIQEGTKH